MISLDKSRFVVVHGHKSLCGKYTQGKTQTHAAVNGTGFSSQHVCQFRHWGKVFRCKVYEIYIHMSIMVAGSGIQRHSQEPLFAYLSRSKSTSVSVTRWADPLASGSRNPPMAVSLHEALVSAPPRSISSSVPI